MNCDFEVMLSGVHRCKHCRRGWHGSSFAVRECHGPVASQKILNPVRVTYANRPAEETPLRVGMLLACWCCGGVERYHEAIYKHTSPKIRWSGLAIGDGGPTMPGPLAAVAKHMPILSIADLCEQSDIILTWAVADLSGLSRFHGPVVTISHGDGDWLRGKLTDSINRATHYLAVSREAANAFPEHLRSLATIHPMGSEIDRICPSRPRNEIRRDWGIRDDQFAVGFVGRFSPEKNPYHVAHVVEELNDDRFVAIYHGHAIYGEQEFKSRATEIARGRIRFIGPEAHTGDVFHGLDCLVQASHAEGGPMVAVEAWLTETPLLTTNVGVITDDDELRNLSVVLPKLATMSDWANAVDKISSNQSTKRPASARRIAMIRYSAAASARRWENYLLGLVPINSDNNELGLSDL